MGRLATATRAFFRSLFDAAAAEQVERALSGQLAPALPEPRPVAAPAPVPPPAPAKPARSEALTLLADRKSTRLNSSHIPLSRMPSSA